MWAWEVEEFPGVLHGSGRLVDEVWTCSAHARRAIAAAVDVPVHNVPPPVVARPAVARSRAELGLPDGFTFLFCFDFFSVADRKNPFGVIDAFCRAFAPGDGPHLVIKSINGSTVVTDLERVRLHAARAGPTCTSSTATSPHSTRPPWSASCDAYVSLHRAEGFGYTMAEAMLAGRPVVATGYSGNLEFMDERNSFLVGYDLVPVGEGKGPYPAASRWADPDLDEAAAAMRRIVEDPAGAAAVGERARQDIVRFHSAEARVPLVAARLAAVRSARADDAVARAAALAPGLAVDPGRAGWAGPVGARRCASGAVWPASSASSARPRLPALGGTAQLGDEHDHGEHEPADEGGDVEHLVGRVVQVQVAQVVHEVGQRVEDPGRGRRQHDRAGQGHQRHDRDRGEGEVERPEVAHEVLVVGPVGRHPRPPAARELVEERPRGHGGPQPHRHGDEQRGRPGRRGRPVRSWPARYPPPAPRCGAVTRGRRCGRPRSRRAGSPPRACRTR